MTVFEALADPTRLLILDLLRQRERSVGELVERIDLTQPAVSQHLRVLRECGLVRVQPDAQRRIYRIDPKPLRKLDAWLDGYRKFWSSELYSLERHLDKSP